LSQSFRNDTHDVVVLYGMKFGDAEYIGHLTPGTVTRYYNFTPEDHPVEMRDSSGSWVVVSSGSYSVSAGNKHAATLFGSHNSYLSVSVYEE